jgi:hypothetical protein
VNLAVGKPAAARRRLMTLTFSALERDLRLEVLTCDGERFWAGPTSDDEYEAIVAEGGRRAEIYR